MLYHDCPVVFLESRSCESRFVVVASLPSFVLGLNQSRTHKLSFFMLFALSQVPQLMAFSCCEVAICLCSQLHRTSLAVKISLCDGAITGICQLFWFSHICGSQLAVNILSCGRCERRNMFLSHLSCGLKLANMISCKAAKGRI